MNSINVEPCTVSLRLKSGEAPSRPHPNMPTCMKNLIGELADSSQSGLILQLLQLNQDLP